MSPEQARGKVVDRRADIWAFGAVLYEMLTGRRAFAGTDVTDTLAAVVRAEPEWQLLPDAMSPSLRVFMQRCLEKDAKHRVGDVHDVRLALEGAFETAVSEPAVAPASVRQAGWWRGLALALGMLVVGSLLTGLAFWSLARPGPQPVARFQILLAADEAFSGVGRPIVAISPRGTHVVYSANNALSLRPLDQLQSTTIPGTDGAHNPFFSPDGQWLGFWADGQLKRVSVSGGAPVTLGEASEPIGVSWGEDDMILFGEGPTGIWQVPGTGGTPEVLIAVEEGELAHGPQGLPGGNTVLFTLWPRGAASAQIVAQSLETGERTVLIDNGTSVRYVRTGHLVYALEGALLAVPFDASALTVTGSPVPLVEGVATARASGGPGGLLATGLAQFSLSRSGSLVYVPGVAGGAAERTLVWVDRKGRDEPVGAPPRAYGRPRLSPDGTRVAVDVSEGDNDDVWIHDLERGTDTKLTFDPAQDQTPIWTPDGERVVFRSNHEGAPNLYWREADGTRPVERLTTSPNPQRPYGWTNDGQLVFLETNPETSSDLWLLSLEGERTPEPLIETPHRDSQPAVSPDGRWIAYFSDETGQREIYVQPFPSLDGRWQISGSGGHGPLWSLDGRELFHPNLLAGQMLTVPITTEGGFAPGNPEVLFQDPNFVLEDAGGSYDVASDGRFLMLREGETSGESTRDEIIIVENWHQELLERVPLP